MPAKSLPETIALITPDSVGESDCAAKELTLLCKFLLDLQVSVNLRLPPGIAMNVNVLTSGYWPTYPHLEAKLPDELSRYQAVFKVVCVSHRLHCRA